jgi:hypothetical protein
MPAAAGMDRLLTRYYSLIPACDSAWTLTTISWQFFYKERRFWSSSNTLHGFEEVREIAFRPGAGDSIPRRYCEAKVRVSDGNETLVRYWIGSNTGFAGALWGVEWCVVGYDHNLAYAPRCRMALP